MGETNGTSGFLLVAPDCFFTAQTLVPLDFSQVRASLRLGLAVCNLLSSRARIAGNIASQLQNLTSCGGVCIILASNFSALGLPVDKPYGFPVEVSGSSLRGEEWPHDICWMFAKVGYRSFRHACLDGAWD